MSLSDDKDIPQSVLCGIFISERGIFCMSRRVLRFEMVSLFCGNA